ncbi:putative lipase [Aspergillus pseudotamarii]|uniref:Putative lipase n=1 Tax=Aspergillus pseudotamarii TaxID=132259 RepID=A0A5N6T7J3_ASPPS|nr:putative lipase [Aspergillus pseudotamarii]KAE8142315.1 putative lipase [Aspergillus pseudotamarii]
MRLFYSILLVLSLGFLQAFAVDLPQKPDVDDFYHPDPHDDTWHTQKPGYIIKARDVTMASLWLSLPSKAKAYQLLYVTQDVYEKPAYAVTTIVVPVRPNFKRILSLQIAYDSPDNNCSPSYGLQHSVAGAAATWSRTQLYTVLPWLQQGPVMNIPDYEGINAAFTVGPQSAYHTLDSIRAALNSHDTTGISPSARTVMFGYSGGAFASEWAAEYHQEYASELKIAGAVLGGPPPNISSTYEHSNGGNSSELNVWAILGVMNAYKNVSDFVHSDLKETHKAAFLDPQKRCSRCEPREYVPGPPLSNADISDFFKHGNHFLYKFKDTLDYIGLMGKRSYPKFPLYIYQGTNDDITAPVSHTDDLVEEFCKNGVKVWYRRYLGLDHFETSAAGVQGAWLWTMSVFNNPFFPRSCSTKDIAEEDDGELDAISDHGAWGQLHDDLR